MECLFCNEELMESLVNPGDYLSCPICRVHIWRHDDPVDYTDDWFDDKYILHYKNILESDLDHYMRIFSESFSNKLKENKFDTIYAFGGGFPKLESFLNYNKLITYDINASKYEKYSGTFCQMFHVDKSKIKFIDAMITPDYIDSINFGENDLITFVHFLEHVDQSYMAKLFDVLKNKKVNILVYQPEISASRNKDWFHFHREHINLITVKWLKRHFRNDLKLNITLTRKWSDDFLLFSKFKKRRFLGLFSL